MKIAFDNQIFLLQGYGGISRYICSLANHLSLLSEGHHIKICAPIHFNRNLLELNSKFSINFFLNRPKYTKLATAITLVSNHLSDRLMEKFHPDIIHETYYSNCDNFKKTDKVVVTVHDMIHEKYSSMFSNSIATSRLKLTSVNRADHIICISENTKLDLMYFFNTPDHKISVIHHGIDELFFASNQVNQCNSRLTSPYVLFVGSRDGYKNFPLLLEAYASSSWLKKNFSIVCFGGGALSDHELLYATNLGIDLNNIKHISGSDKTLSALYRRASALVYPSLYEGFGFPPLEAMASQCPVITSLSSSLPEIVGEAAEYFDPTSSESLRCAIEKVLASESYAKSLIDLGNANVIRFSWEKTAEQTSALYQKLL